MKNNNSVKTLKTVSTNITEMSIAEMNDLLIKAAKLIYCFELFNETSIDFGLSTETSNKLFDLFNEASYQDVMLFKYLLDTIDIMLKDMPDDSISDGLSDGSYYFDLIWEKIRG